MAHPGAMVRGVAVTLLLDTCTFLWLLSDDPRLPLRARTECRTLCFLFIHPRAPNLIGLRSVGTMPA